jgi:transposase
MDTTQDGILASISASQASANTKLHCLYGYFFLGLTVSNLATIYHKSPRTIRYWVQRWEEFRSAERLSVAVEARKFNAEKQRFIIDFYEKYPCSFLDEVRDKFMKQFHMNISKTTIWRIVNSAGLTRKVIERRAIEISVNDIIRFYKDLQSLPFHWTYQNLVFLDEVGFDNRDMFRKRGYALKGERIIYRGEFTRKERCSLLCFLGMNGILETFSTSGTFDRRKFISSCRDFALRSGHVYQYPAAHSVWILDGASIHCEPHITYYLRSLGIYTIYLPAYCPFFNPIEIVFGNVKSTLQRHYVENRSLSEMKLFIAKTMTSFQNRDMLTIFKKCGYVGSGVFDPSKAFSQNLKNFGF